MKFLNFLFLFIISISCSVRHHNHLSIQATNTALENGNWLIDEPLLEKLDIGFEHIVITTYEEILIEKFKNIHYISELNGISSLNKSLEKTSKTLDLYQSQTNLDYLISTKLEIVPCNDPLKKILAIKLVAYDLKTKSKIFENEYHSAKKFKGSQKTNPEKFEKLISESIKIAIKDFKRKDNWRMTKSI